MRQNCGKRKNTIWQFLDNFGENIQKVKKTQKRCVNAFNTFYRENATF